MPFADRSRAGWWRITHSACRSCGARYALREGEPFPQLHCGRDECKAKAVRYRIRVKDEHSLHQERNYTGGLLFPGEEIVRAREAYL